MRGPALFVKRAVVLLCLVLVMVPLFASLSRAQISVVSIELHTPTQATAGETISVVVTLRKPQGEAITGYLRSYITARPTSVVGFLGSDRSSSSVALNAEGWRANQISISMGENETEHTYILTNKVMDECPTVEALLSVRLSNVNGDQGRRYSSSSLIFIGDASFGSVVATKIAVAAAMSLMMISAVIVAKKQTKFIK